MATDSHGRGTRAYRRLRDALCRPRPGARCWLCGELIVFGLRPRHRLGPSLDHVVPLNRGGALLDPNNARLAHYGCNCDKRDRVIDTAIPINGINNASRQW